MLAGCKDITCWKTIQGKRESREEVKISFFFAWYDLWIGFYFDNKSKALYICPIPCCVFKIEKRYSISPLHNKDLVEHSETLRKIDERITSAYGVPPELIDKKNPTHK